MPNCTMQIRLLVKKYSKKRCYWWDLNRQFSDYHSASRPKARTDAIIIKGIYTPDGTRTHNLWIRSPTPYPLGHRGWWFEWSASPTKSVILKQHGVTIPLFLYEEMNKPFVKKKIWNASRICVSSLRRGHANLLCIIPILVYVQPKLTQERPCLTWHM